ncbi:erythromycin 3''-O-methyltransferase-like [Antennarius striatus]|uniref:erythromycin 3''-O-methyltransferase-like n=1 Tax=Antennarius striatus TaxID=241820 RepID=UPI0035B1858C
MAYRHFEGKEQASSYWKHRFPPSDHLIQQLLDFVEKQKGGPYELAVDVGCGPGRGTALLAKHFASVVGLDVSPAQIEVALQRSKEPNITFRQSVAEELPFADSSVDLVTSMSAFHWFDRQRFLQEVHRVLKPRGCLALFGFHNDIELNYSNCCSHTLSQIIKEFCAALKAHRIAHIGPYHMNLYKEAYESIPYPGKEWHEHVLVKRTMTLFKIMRMMETYGDYQAVLSDDPQKATRLTQDVKQRLMSVMGVTSMETEVEVVTTYFYLVACKPQEV